MRATPVPLRRAPWVLLWCLLAPALATTYADADLWGNVRFGLDMVRHRRLDAVDPFAFTQDVPWINHEWLSEAIMGVAYRAGGSTALVLLKAALVSAAFALVLSALAGAWPLASAALLLLLTWGAFPLIFTVRAQLWTFLFVCLLARLLITTPSRWWLVGLPLLFALWVNLHGGWIVGAAMLGVWTVHQLWRPASTRSLAAGIATLSAGATLINPYGWDMLRFLAATVRLSRPDIAEWQPLTTRGAAMWIPYAAVAGLAGLTVLSKKRPPLDRILIIGGLAAGALRVRRLSPLWIAVAIILISPAVVAWSRRIPVRFWILVAPSRAAAAIALVPVLCAAAVSAREAALLSRCVRIVDEWSPDAAATRALRTGAVAGGTLVPWFDWGHYAFWHGSPPLRVSMDGRRETLYSDEVIASHDALYGGTPEGIAYLRRLHPTYVWAPPSLTTLHRALEAEGYRFDVETKGSFIAVRPDAPALRTADGPGGPRCFPGP